MVAVALVLLGGLWGERAQAEIQFWPARLDFPAGESPSSLAIADLDGDEVPDLAVANRDSVDAGGRVVASLRDQTLAVGHHDVLWDLTRSDGCRVCAGIYLVQVEGRPYRGTGCLAIVR